MAELGSGSTPRSDFPGAIDTNTVNEVDSPSASKTLITAAKIEDGYSAIINIQTELGTDPAGTLTDVKTFLQTQHNTNGTHKATTFSGAITWPTDNTYDIGASGATRPRDLYLGGTLKNGIVPLARMQVDEQSGSSSTVWTTSDPTVLSLASMTVNAGDRVFLTWWAGVTPVSTTTRLVPSIVQSSGTAIGTWIYSGGPALTGSHALASDRSTGTAAVANFSGTILARITGNGTIVFSMKGFAETVNATNSLVYLNALVLRGA